MERRAKLSKSIIFQLIVTDKVVLCAIYSTCARYTKTIIHLGVGESKGNRPEARGYVIYSPRATHEGNKSHDNELKAYKRLIFTMARIPQGMQKYTEEKGLYCSSFFCFSTLHAGTGGIHKFLGFLIMLVF